MSEIENKLSSIQNIINRLDGELRTIRSQIVFIKSQINRDGPLKEEQPPPKEAVPFEAYLKKQCEED